jgi:hypothetical protein
MIDHANWSAEQWTAWLAPSTPDWLAGQLGGVMHDLLQPDGTQKGCSHVTPRGPVVAAAWAPGVIVCPDCTRLLGLSGMTCSACGESTPKPILRDVQVRWALRYLFLLCGRCAPGVPRGL